VYVCSLCCADNNPIHFLIQKHMVNIFICSVFYGPLAFVIGDAGSASFPLNPSPPLVGSGVIGCEDGLRNDLYCV